MMRLQDNKIKVKNNYETTYDNTIQLKRFIKRLLRNEGIKQIEIAEQMNTTKQNLYKLLNKKTLNFDDLKKLCDILGYDIVIKLEKKEKEK